MTTDKSYVHYIKIIRNRILRLHDQSYYNLLLHEVHLSLQFLFSCDPLLFESGTFGPDLFFSPRSFSGNLLFSLPSVLDHLLHQFCQLLLSHIVSSRLECLSRSKSTCHQTRVNDEGCRKLSRTGSHLGGVKCSRVLVLFLIQ